MFRRSRRGSGPIGLVRRRLWAATSVMILAVSAVSGCASQASSPKPAAAQARTLSQKELEAARLTQGEASGYGVALGNETPADMKPVVTTTTPEICLPAMKLLRHGWADGAVGYTRFHLSDPANSVGAKSVALTSYPPVKPSRYSLRLKSHSRRARRWSTSPSTRCARSSRSEDHWNQAMSRSG